MSAFSNIRKLLNKPQKVKFLILQAAFIFSAALQMLSIGALAPYITLLSDPSYIETNKYFAKAYEIFAAENYLDFLLTYSIVVCSLIFVANVVASLVLWLSIKFTIDIGAGLQRKMFSAYMKNEYIFFLEQNSSYLITTITQEIPRMVYMVFQPFMQAVSQVVLTTFIVVGLIIVDPLLAAAAAMIVGSVYLTIYMVVRKRAVESGKTVSSVNRKKLRLLTESIKGIREIKLLGAERWYEKEVDATTRRGLGAQAYITLSGDLPRYVVETIVFGAIIVLGIYLITTGAPQQQIVTTLSFYAMAGYKLLPAAQTIYKAITSIKANGNVVEQVTQRYERAVERASSFVPEHASVALEGAFDTVKLEAVGYHYPNSQHDVVSKFNLDLKANSLIAFVGGSGAGKTTIANLVAGLITPTSGQIVVDDTVLTKKHLRQWQNEIGYVPQSVFMIDDTVVKNICFGIPENEIDRDLVVEVAKKANIHEFIENLPNGYDTKVGENGDLLSGGQRQRLAIARALYKRPSILILDEATSALDNITERKILSEIIMLAKDMLVIMIAHRLSTVEMCDTIYLLENGQLQDSGTYQSLLETSAYFKELVQGSEEGEIR